MSDTNEVVCADCGGWDVEWMYKCTIHKIEYCRGCSCPYCEEEADEEVEYSYYPEDKP